MKNAIAHGLTLAVTVSIANMIMYQIRKGEPRVAQSVISGLAVGIGIAAFRCWKSRAKANADDALAE